MSDTMGSRAGDLVETLTFVAAAPPGGAGFPVTLVGNSFRGAVVLYFAVGQYLMQLTTQNQIDPLQRSIVLQEGGGIPCLTEAKLALGATDQLIPIQTLVAGAPADSGDSITVIVTRSSNG